MSNIKIGDDDLVFTYKERAFNGFAPCFDNGVYSLACCKGARNGNSLRQNACEKFLSGKTVWVLAIAAAKITDKGNNTSSIAYKHGDAIYLAKVDGVYTWKDYSDLHSDRKDSSDGSSHGFRCCGGWDASDRIRHEQIAFSRFREAVCHSR